jgi:hypothetical protein
LCSREQGLPEAVARVREVPAPAGQHAEAHLQGQAGPRGQGGRATGRPFADPDPSGSRNPDPFLAEPDSGSEDFMKKNAPSYKNLLFFVLGDFHFGSHAPQKRRKKLKIFTSQGYIQCVPYLDPVPGFKFES